jgi:hypothetical protein
MPEGEAKAKGPPVLCTLGEQDIPELRAFLAKHLSKPADIPSLLPDYLHWKYFHPRADYPAPRSWAYRDDGGKIIAHIGIGPITFLLPGSKPTANMMIDWAASPEMRGIGLRIMEEVSKDLPLHFGLGGTAAAQRSMKRQKYTTPGTLETFRKALRPLGEFRDEPPPFKRWHVYRMVRGWRSNLESRRLAADWSSERISSFRSIEAVLRSPDDCPWTRCDRTADMMDYMLACPANTRAFVLRHKGSPLGYALMTQRRTQVRIADLWVSTADAKLWTGAYAAAEQAARSYPDAWDLTATCSTPTLRAALLANRFEPVIERPLWLKDPAGLMRDAKPLHVQAIEADSWYL